MKFQTWQAFGKHLQDSTPDYLAPIYLIASPCSYERGMISKKIFQALEKKDPTLSKSFLEAAKTPIEELLARLGCFSLFSSLTAICVKGIEKYKKGDLEKLSAYAKNPSPRSFLILEGGSVKSCESLYQNGKKEIVVFDLTAEKPWERKARFQKYLLQLALKEGKTLALDGAAYLIEQIGLDLPGLQQQMDKLICYVGEGGSISLADVQKIALGEKSLNLWQLSETLVFDTPLWKEKGFSSFHSADTSELFPFLTQVRHQLQMGLQLCVMADAKIEIREIISHFP
ncbi:MAG: hypothetical protein HYZ48_04080, partial [Chlamydiales bacterium]|nr:hypothetical protein [Chlamydiales bacterium]